MVESPSRSQVHTLHADTMTAPEAYRLMIGSIVPRPIAWVSSVSTDGVNNLAPYSFFTGLTSSPPLLCFSAIHSRANKDTLKNVADTGEFVVNVVSDNLGEAMNATSEAVPADIDEFALGKLTPIPSLKVRAPRVAESPIHMECRLHRLVDLGVDPSPTTLIIGEILVWHLRDDVYDTSTRRIRLNVLNPLARLAGDWYAFTREQFQLVRPDPTYAGR